MIRNNGEICVLTDAAPAFQSFFCPVCLCICHICVNCGHCSRNRGRYRACRGYLGAVNVEIDLETENCIFLMVATNLYDHIV